MLLTNGEAKLIYSKTEGGEQNQEQPITSGQVENLAFTVTYLDETGAKLTSAPYTETRYWYGDTVAIEKGPVKTGYDFTVWTVTGVTPAEGATSFDMPKNNVTLKANYTEKDYLLSTGVYYISDNVVPPDSVLYSYSSVGSPRLKKDAQVTLPDFVDVQDSEHDGVWKFRGWYEYYGLSTARKYEGTFTMPARDVSLDAVWTFQKTERYGVDVTKTATRDRTLADGTTDTVALATTGDKVRVGDVIHYTVTIKNTGNVAFPAGSYAGDTFAAATGSLIDDATQKKIPSGSQTEPIKIALTEPNVTVTKTYTYIVLEADTRITNTANASIPNGTMEPERDSDAVVVTVEKPHGVTYEFESGLPTEVQTLLPKQDTNKYYKGDSVTLPTLTENTKTIDGIKYTFDGWYESNTAKYAGGSEYTMGDADVTFVGKWNSVTVNPKYKLSYVFKSGDDTITTLPQGVLNKKPADSDAVEAGTGVTLPSGFTTTVHDDENGGTWTFGGWYTDDNLSAESKITGDTYPMPEGGKTLYGKWTFEADKPEITEAGYTVEYYRQDADGNYSNKPYYTRTTTDAGVPLKGNVGDTVKIEDLEPFYKEHYKGYEFDKENEKNVPQCTLQADADENVLKLYYKAEALMTLDKDYVAYRDGEELDLSDGEELKAGDVIQYTITLKNTGTRNLTNVTVEDIFTGAEGELVFISGDAYEIDEGTGIISLKDTLKPGETVDIRADYEVQLNDSGWRITNEVLGDATELPPAGKPHASVTITPEALKNYEIHVSADKYVKSVKGTFNKDEEDVDFTFAVSSDKRGKNELDRFDITVDESVKAGETSSRFDGGITIRLTEEEFDDLKWETFEGDGKKYPVVYLREIKGSDKKMRYDTSVVTLYLLVPQVIVTSHDPIYKTTSLNAWVDPTDSTLWPEFTNVYGKESSSSDTVKVGPQLNRDDHVAYIMGYPDGTVQPKGEITRAEACTIFFRLLTDSSRDYYFSKTNDYTDVNAGDWFNNAISTLSNAGIVTGYNDGTFRPNQPITRGEMAKIIANFANLNKGTKSFTDLSGHWSKTYVELAAGNGWIAGYPDSSFRPDQKITRAETVTMINRVLERVPAKELRLLSRSIMLTFPDNNPGDWYYIAIQEASNSHEYQRSVYETTGDEMWTKLIDNVDWTKLEK